MFQEDGYQIIGGLLPYKTRESLSKTIDVLQQKGLLQYSDGQVEKAYSAYGNPVTEKLLQTLCPVFSEITQLSLFPTYSYSRIYLKGALLSKHVDREACEISATITLDVDSPSIWPIFLETYKKIVRVELEPGDTLIYKGQELPHWRECFEGERQIQVFLHYVRQDGQYKDFKYDKSVTTGILSLASNQRC